MADDEPARLQPGDDSRVGVEDVLAGPVADRLGEPAPVVDGNHDVDPGLLAEPLVLLAESGRHVHDAGAFGRFHEVGAEHHERA